VTTTATTPVRSGHRRLRGGRVLRTGHVVYWWLEILMVLAYYGVYSLVRNHSNASPDKAFHNAQRLIGWEKAMWMYHEQPLHAWARGIRPLIIFLNYSYGSWHFIVTVGTAVFLYRKWTNDYPRWRNNLGISTGLALIGFYTFPLMPPRLLDTHAQQVGLAVRYGFIDTLAKDPTFWSFNSGAVAKVSNQFAAMPSVHCCWALWCACALFPRVKPLWGKVLAAIYPVFTVTIIVLTANHYFLDAVGGFAIFGIGYAGARLFTRAGREPPVSLAEA
jgi:hypothetical protein